MIKADLHSGWTVRAAAGTVPPAIGDGPLAATVPGTIHTDLLDAGLIPDPFLGVNEESLAWLHRSGWLYETTAPRVEAAADERVDLVFDGLDTVATVTLGGAELGQTVNMHRSYRFDVRSLLAAGPAPLSVRFDSALEYAEEIEKLVGPRPSPYPHPFNAVRKMACSFGWDWGPDLQTAGIWKPVRLERWRVARLAEVRPLATLDSDGRTGRLQVHVVLEHSGLSEGTALAVRVRAAGQIASLDPSLGFVDLELPDAPVWWPVGQGSQPLVPVTVELLDGDEVLGSVTRRVGFRSVVVDQTDGAFTLVVNGREVFALGLNWIPEDHLLTRLTRERYAAAIDRAVSANANLLRVWGGGIYESDDFYDLCDERGILGRTSSAT